MEFSSDQLNIDTPELVDIEMPLAGIGSRFIALLIDSIILFIGWLLLLGMEKFLLPGIVSYSKHTALWTVAVFTLLSFLLYWGYFTLFEAFWNGRTPGKRVAKIRVIQRSGRAIGLFESMARNLIRVIDQIPLIYVVGVISMFVSRQHQRLGDLAAGTLVVRDRQDETPAWAGEGGARTFTAQIFVPVERAPEPHLAVTLPSGGIAKLAASDLQVLEGFFARRLDMSMATREALAGRIAAAIQAKSGLEVPASASVETFLEATARQLRDIARLQ
jgi:uncharacterized RDD family membrane protein YckC